MAVKTNKERVAQGLFIDPIGLSLGYYANAEKITRFGLNKDLSTPGEDIWTAGNSYQGFLSVSSAQTLIMFSTSSEDSAAGSGTGARSVTLTGLDINWDAITETVSLDGLNVTSTALTFLRLNDVTVNSAGGSRRAAGLISILTVNSLTRMSEVVSGLGNSLMAMYTVPSNKTALMLSFHSSVLKGGGASVGVDIHLHQTLGDVETMVKEVGVSTNGTNYLQHFFPLPEAFVEKTDIHFEGHTAANNTEVATGFSIILVDNE